MKLLAIIFFSMFIYMFFCANIKMEDHRPITVQERAGVCVIAAAVMTLIIGLPILGIVWLLV